MLNLTNKTLNSSSPTTTTPLQKMKTTKTETTTSKKMTRTETTKTTINSKVSLMNSKLTIDTTSSRKMKWYMTSPTRKESLLPSWPNTKRQESSESGQSRSPKTLPSTWQLIATPWWTGTHSLSQKSNSAKKESPSSSEGTSQTAASKTGNSVNSKLSIDSWLIHISSTLPLQFSFIQ